MLEHAERLILLLREKNLTLAAAESCTGGALSAELVNIPGASKVFMGGIIAYTPEAKTMLLDIPRELLEEKGVVSQETAEAMARAAAERTGAHIGIGITGVAGPEALEDMEPGVVYISIWWDESFYSKRLNIPGSRSLVRTHAVEDAIAFLLEEVFGQKI